MSAPPLARRHMPSAFDISLARYTEGFAQRLPKDRGPRQDLPGFDPEYTNIVDYIVRITHRIWEDRDIDYIAQCYASDSRVFDEYGLQIGNAKIIDDTRHTTAAFPDIVLDARDCIWAGDAQTGLRTSHLLRITGTNTGESRFGAPSGRRVDFSCIANCVSRDNDIFLEHVCYSTGQMMRQLGLDPAEQARAMLDNPPKGWPRDTATWAALRREGAPTRPLCETAPVTGFDPDRFARDAIAQLWADPEQACATLFAPDCRFVCSEGAPARAPDQLVATLTQLRQIGGSERVQVDEVYWMGNITDGYDIAARWSLEAQGLQIWGLSQMAWREGKLMGHAMLWNEFDVIMQQASARA